MLVFKFGGSSVANANRIRVVASLIKERDSHLAKVVVVSAMGDTTDHLLQAGQNALNEKLTVEEIRQLHLATARELEIPQDEIEVLLRELENLVKGISLVKEISPHAKDYLVSFGERLSARILAAYLRKLDLPAQAYDAWDLGFISNEEGGQLLANQEKIIQEKVRSVLASGILPVVTGYIAKNERGSFTTLGRGGSDLTATIIGSAIQAKEIQVWKDVNGVLSADPRLVAAAKEVAELSFEEACELAYFGSQILHPRAIHPLLQSKVPVRIKNSYNPEHPGTSILAEHSQTSKGVRLITSKQGVTLVDLVALQMLGPYGYLAKIFSIFAKHKISVDLLASSDISVSLTLDDTYDLSKVLPELQEVAIVELKTNRAIISLIADVSNSSSLLSEAFHVFSEQNINVQMLSQGCSKVKFSMVVNDDQARTAIVSLHQKFFDS